MTPSGVFIAKRNIKLSGYYDTNLKAPILFKQTRKDRKEYRTKRSIWTNHFATFSLKKGKSYAWQKDNDTPNLIRLTSGQYIYIHKNLYNNIINFTGKLK